MMGDDVSGSNLGMWVAAYMHDIHSLTPADWSTRLGEFLFPRQHQNVYKHVMYYEGRGEG